VFLRTTFSGTMIRRTLYEEENTMAAKTVISKFMLAGALGVVAATASFNPIGHSLEERLDAADLAADEGTLSKSSKRALGVSKPKGMEIPASRGLQVTFNSASLEFRIEGEDETLDLVQEIWEIDEQAFVTEEISLAAMAVIAKVGANGFSIDEVVQSQFCEDYCSSSTGAKVVLEAAIAKLVKVIGAGDRLFSLARRGPLDPGYVDDPSVLSNSDDGFSVFPRTGSGEDSEGGLRDNGGYIRIDFDPIAGGGVPGPTGGGGGGGGGVDNDGSTFGQDELATAMDSLERALSVGEGDPGIYQGSWSAHAYGDQERSLQTLRVVTDMAFALTVYNAGSILFCGVEEAPVFVYELDVSATPDDIEILQAALDEALEQKSGSRRMSRTDLEEVHAMLVEDDVHLEATLVSYREGVETKPVTLKGNAAQQFLGSCTDSLIDP
jgi:hypothetical protein